MKNTTNQKDLRGEPRPYILKKTCKVGLDLIFWRRPVCFMESFLGYEILNMKFIMEINHYLLGQDHNTLNTTQHNRR